VIWTDNCSGKAPGVTCLGTCRRLSVPRAGFTISEEGSNHVYAFEFNVCSVGVLLSGMLMRLKDRRRCLAGGQGGGKLTFVMDLHSCSHYRNFSFRCYGGFIVLGKGIPLQAICGYHEIWTLVETLLRTSTCSMISVTSKQSLTHRLTLSVEVSLVKGI
jgi:hypothetical protein